MTSPPRRRRVRERNEAYTSRILAAVVVTTALSILVFSLPSRFGAKRVGWVVLSPNEIIALEEVRFEDGLNQLKGSSQGGSRTEVTEAPAPKKPIQESGPDSTEAGGAGEISKRAVEKIAPLVLAAAETMPQIRGGLGAYYINIRYPKVAIDAGIQGRLVLDFVVSADGHPSQIEVYSPLHPLCDSAAVQALRKTLFMPGRQDGEEVAVKMRLPVLFMIQRTSADSTRT